ncbi:hypothetical protein ES703_105418 [subsurface metagenome]
MPLKNTIKIIKRVEKTHLNLGLPIIFAKVVDLSNLGMFIVAGRARGKGAILDAVMQLRHRKVMEIARLTPAGLKRIADDISDSEITFINPDITALYTSYLKDAAINAMAHLISEHALPPSWTDRYEYKIENCTISFLSGTQPKLLREISKLPNWESMYKDRFLRFCIFYPCGTPAYVKGYPNVGEIDLPSDFKPEQVTLPQPLKRERIYYRMKAIIQRQTSEGRCGQYVNSLLKSHAYLNQRQIVIKNDLEVLELFTVNLMADYWLSERTALAGSLRFEPDSYVLLFYMIEHGSARRKELRIHFKVSQKTLVKYMRPLMNRNIIVGTYGADVYRINPEWYSRYVLPIINWSKKQGIIV